MFCFCIFTPVFINIIIIIITIKIPYLVYKNNLLYYCNIPYLKETMKMLFYLFLLPFNPYYPLFTKKICFTLICNYIITITIITISEYYFLRRKN